MSNPFIILTNESQWSECFGTLIKRDAFKDSLSMPWPSLANTLQQHFLIATRQDILLLLIVTVAVVLFGVILYKQT